MRHCCALLPLSSAEKRRGVSGKKTGVRQPVQPLTKGPAERNRRLDLSSSPLFRPELPAVAAGRG